MDTPAWNIDQRWHRHRRDYVFPDGVKLGDVIDAIAAAGLAENYTLANELKIRYAVDVCTRCAHRYHGTSEQRTSLMQLGINAWGMICSRCELEFIAMGRTKRDL